MNYRDTLTITLEAWCSCLLRLPNASSQKREASKGEPGPLGWQIWVGHGSQDERGSAASVVLPWGVCLPHLAPL